MHDSEMEQQEAWELYLVVGVLVFAVMALGFRYVYMDYKAHEKARLEQLEQRQQFIGPVRQV